MLEVIDHHLCTRHAHENGTPCVFRGLICSMYGTEGLVMNPTLAMHTATTSAKRN